MVVVGSKVSTLQYCSSSVPQGSVLGPTLFTIYINDIYESIKHCQFLQFADDLKVYQAIDADFGNCNLIQNDLDNILKWSVKWELLVNLDKCNLVCFNNCHERNAGHIDIPLYYFGANVFKQTKMHDDLGVLFNSDFDFKDHIDIIVKKAHKSTALLCHGFHFSTDAIKLKLYSTFIHLQLEYVTQIWNPYLISNIKKLERIQQSFTRHLKCYAIHKCSYNDRLNKASLLSLHN